MNATSVAAGLAIVVMLANPSLGADAQYPSDSDAAAARSSPSPAPALANAVPSDRATHAVLRIASVEIISSNHEPTMHIVRARGLASSSGWEEVELVPLTRGAPPDGILHLILVARPPRAAADATGYEAVEAIFPLAPDHGFKGVNVHAATNGAVVDSMPGYAQTPLVADDCGTCVGKMLVPKDGRVPLNRNLLREDQLPPLTRIVRPTDGLMGLESNPNRLTLIVNEDGLIVSAVWD